MQNSLITGSTGMIGNNINFGYRPCSKTMDITDEISIENYISNLKDISCIIHLAAINLRDSENNPSKSINININGTINMLKVAMKLNIPFILISSGAVFSSTNQNNKFNENCKMCPNCIYGFTKESSERVALLYNKTILIRTGWLFGGHQKTHYKFVETSINNLLTNTPFYASNNFLGSPTYVMDLIDQMKYLINNSKYGIHHVVNNGIGTGYDIALKIAETMDKDIDLIKSVDSQSIPNAGPPRSYSEVLETIYDYNILRPWEEALEEYVNNYLFKINQYKNKNIKINKEWSNRITCRLCNSYDLELFLTLESTPSANHFVKNRIKQNKIPLELAKCKNCHHIQLLQIIDPSFLYSEYLYVSSTSNTMTKHLQDNVMNFIIELQIDKNDNILEIGANDGVCIKQLLDNGFNNIIGIDPAININKRHNLPIICDFFGSHTLNILKNKSFKLIYAFHCCAHIENIQDVFKTIYNLLDENGVFIMEVGYFYQVFKNNLFDVIYHEHIDYHTCLSMQQFCNKNNLILYKIKENNIQGGSIQFYISKNKIIDKSINENINKEKEIELFNIINLQKWKNNIINCGKDINYILNSFILNGKKIIGYGASAKSTTFLHQFKLSHYLIKYIIDDNIYKQNMFTPGLHIPITSINILDTENFDYIIILSCNFVDEIIKRLEKYRNKGLRIIIPFPEIKII
jgi:dTDP-4-dehydrorhamnose reductase/SAM-dependent methyltransferase